MSTQPLIEHASAALGSALFHSLWQGVLVGAIVGAIASITRDAVTRHALWCLGLLSCAAWFIITLTTELASPATPQLPAVTAISGSEGGVIRWGLSEALSLLWLVGFVLATLRLTLQWRHARALRTRALIGPQAQWQRAFDELRSVIGVSGRVRLLVSEQARCPMVVGVLSPSVVVPASVLLMLSPAQVRMVMAHELAHIRRCDHILNTIQVVIETVLFYHPVVWWMSRRARIEREHCCDDAAVHACGDALGYARMLTELEDIRTTSRAVLAINHGGTLMNRIRRIVNPSHATSAGARRGALALISAATLIVGAGLAQASLSDPDPRSEQIEVIRANVDSGVMTSDQARAVFDELIYPGSGMQERVEVYLEKMRTEIEGALGAGHITPEDARAKLAGIEHEMTVRIEQMFRTRVLGMTRIDAHLSLMAEGLAAQVAAGEISEEEAEEKLAFAEREIGMEKRVDEHLRALTQKVDAAIESGELTREQGRAKLESARRDMEMRVKWASFEMRIKAALAAGSITPEEAKAKTAEMRAEFAAHKEGVRRKDAEDAQEHKGKAGFDWVAFKARVEAAVDRGEMTREEADARYEQAKRRLEEQHRRQKEAESKPVEKQTRLTPNDEAYWHHYGVRPLDDYDGDFVEGC